MKISNILVFLSLALVRCGYLATPQDPASITTTPSVTTPDTYLTLRADVLVPKCLSCHTSGFSYGDFSTYSGTMAKVVSGNPNSSSLFTRTDGSFSPMPPGGREAAISTRIYNWIANGAPAN